jgi:hypothetical protein
MILIVTEDDDVHADLVIDELKARDVEAIRFAPSTFPACARFALSCGTSQSLTLEVGGETIDLDSIGVVWMRRPGTPEPHAEVRDDRMKRYVRAECADVLADVLSTLRCPFVPGPSSAVRLAQMKASQLRVASDLGLSVPDTLITSDPKAALGFWHKHQGRIISKMPSAMAFHRVLGDTFCRYTNRVTHRDLLRLDSVRYAPVTFQAYVEKRVELRVNVFGDDVLCAEIDSQASNQAREDWRHYDLDQTPHRPHELPRAVREQCVALVRRFGLTFGAIDMIVTPEGQYVFVEINPSGQFLWLQDLAGLPLARKMADFLVHLSESKR